MILNVLKILGLSSLAFFIGLALTPVVTRYLYKYKAWKKRSVHMTTDGRPATITQKLHGDEEKKTPRMGGIVIWGSVFIVALLVWATARVFPGEATSKLEFITRSQTWLPLFALFVGATVGLMDDYFVVSEHAGRLMGGLSITKRLFIVAAMGAVGAYWFFVKLGVSHIFVPFFGDLELGLFFIPIFIAVMIGTYAGGVIDGIDGLAGGVFASIFATYGGIAYVQNQMDIAAFCGVITGAILAFLWFNIPPARFYMGDTGTMSLTLTLAIVAFLTNQVAVLPIIAFPLVAAGGSSAIQLLSKKFRGGKKIFLVAPVHHHFEAIGWPSYKVTMRFWVMGVVLAVLGMAIALVGRV